MFFFVCQNRILFVHSIAMVHENGRNVQNYMAYFVLFKHFKCRAKTRELRVTIKIGQSINLYAALQITN